MAYNPKNIPAQMRYEKDHVTRISLKLMNTTDADILNYLEPCTSKQGEIKRLLRLAMAIEAKESKEE